MGRVEAYAAWMMGTGRDGRAFVEAASLAVGMGELESLRQLHKLAMTRSREPREHVELREEPTVTVGLGHPAIGGDPRRLRVLQHEMRRVCLTGALAELPVGPRSAFVLLDLLKLSRADAANIHGSASALASNYTRGVRYLGSLLGPYCEHLQRHSVCRCANRLGYGLQTGLVTYPEPEPQPDTSESAPRPHTSMASLFATIRSPP